MPEGMFQVANYAASHPTTPQQLAQQSLDANGGPPITDKKKTKVSRACDECRRKKVSYKRENISTAH